MNPQRLRAIRKADVQLSDWVAAQKADRASQAKRRVYWCIVVAVAACITMFGIGYLIGVEGKRAIGLAAFVGFSALASALVYGVWEIERDE